MLKDYQKEQGWLYRFLCTSFAQTNLTKIQMYEPNSFHNFLIKENPTLTVKDPRIQLIPYISLCWNVLKHEYVQTGWSSLIIQLSGWTTLTGGGFQDFLKKNNETVSIQKIRTRDRDEVAAMCTILSEAKPFYYRLSANASGSVCVRFRKSPHRCSRSFQRTR